MSNLYEYFDKTSSSSKGQRLGSKEAPNLGTATDLDSRNDFLLRIPNLLNSHFGAEKILSAILKRAAKLLNADQAKIYLLSRDKQILIEWRVHGIEFQAAPARVCPVKNTLVGQTIEKRKPLLITNLQELQSARELAGEKDQMFIESLILFPLSGRVNKSIGVVEFIKTNPTSRFGIGELKFVECLAKQISILIDNIQLYRLAQDSSENLSALDQRKNEMISVIAHEFRTPLNIIQISADLIASNTCPENDRAEVGALLKNGVNRLTNLIGKIKNIAVVKGDNLELHTNPCKLHEIFLELEAKYRPVFLQRQLSFSIDTSPLNLTISADRLLLMVALQNLLSNAVRFTPDGGTIALQGTKIGALVEISVTDTGIGIESSQRDLIFEKFYEISDAMNHSSGEHSFKSAGLGLGLAAVKQIIESHGSTIELESIPGSGSKFYFRMPALP